MNKIKKCYIWYYMFSKRLFRRISFVILLCMIPVIIPAANSVMSDESGIVRIVLCSEDKNSLSSEIINSLLEDDGIILFSECENEEAARSLVQHHEADAAWIFSDKLDERIDKYTSQESVKPFVEVIERSDTIPLQLSREVLFGAVYENMSYSLYKNFIYSRLGTQEEFSESELEYHYDRRARNRSIVELKRLNSDAPVKSSGYLTAPLRGLLSLMVMLCTMAAAMYFLKDNIEGKYDWMPVKKRLAPAFASCLAASVFAGAAVVAALSFSGLSAGIIREVTAMMLFIMTSAGFGLILCICFRSPGKLGAFIPGIIIIMLALSPIFFNMKVLRPVRLMLPTYYYLNSVYNSEYYLYSLFYCTGVYAAAFVLNEVLSRVRKTDAVI